jgi:ribosomal protein S10
LSKKIRVFIHSYKNKEIDKVCRDILESSKNEVEIYLFDKKNAPISLKNEFIHNNKQIKYAHVRWEHRKLEVSRRATLLRGDFDYFLCLSDKVILPKNWDEKCIELSKDNVVLSGSGKAKLNIGSFFVEESYEDTLSPEESFWIDKDFIFLPRSISPLLSHKYQVVTYLDSLVLSLKLNKDGIKIVSLPKNFYLKKEVKEQYSPLSKYHGNNSLIQDIKDGKFNTEEFNRFHKVNLEDLNLLPFETDHVPYERVNTEITTEQGGRFHGEVYEIRT